MDSPMAAKPPVQQSQLNGSSPQVRVGTIYGSSTLRQKAQDNFDGQSPSPQSREGSTGHNSQQKSVDIKPVVVQGKQQGQNIPQPSIVDAPQLCLKFVKATQPDGSPGLTAVLQPVIPSSNQPSPHQQKQTSPVPHVVLAKPPQMKSPPAASPQTKAITTRRKKTVPQKKIAMSSSVDETEEAVNALLVSTSSAQAEDTPSEPRIATWSMQKSQSTRKKAKSTRAAKKPYSRPVPAQTAQQSSPGSSPGGSTEAAQKLLQALTKLLSLQKANSQMSSSPHKPGPSTLADHSQEEPHQLPPVDDRLGLFENQRKTKLKKTTRAPAGQHLVSSQNVVGSSEWSEIERNVDVFMFPVYRCKLCPNYYSTVKNTMWDHMKQIHRWSFEGQPTIPTMEGNGDTTAKTSVQSKLCDIKTVFETRLRSQSTDGFDLSQELIRQNISMEHERQNEQMDSNDIVEVPFPSMTNTEKQIEDDSVPERQMEGGNSDDDDWGPGFEDVDEEEEEEEEQNEKEIEEGEIEEEEEEKDVVRKNEKEKKWKYVTWERKTTKPVEDLSEVRPPDMPVPKTTPRAPKRTATKRSGNRRRKNRSTLFVKGEKNIIHTYFRKNNKDDQSTPNDNNDKENPGEKNRSDDQTKKQSDGGGSTSESESASKLPAKGRPATRSMTKSDDNKETSDDSGAPKEWICISKYEAWKKIGLDPKSRPPWSCDNPDCKGKKTKFNSLSAVLSHHIYKHDIFGDMKQRKIARALGERYSLWGGREKRAVEGACSVDDGEGTGKGMRTKKPVKRLSSDLMEKSGIHLLKKEKDMLGKEKRMREKKSKSKRIRCSACSRVLTTEIGLKMHMRSMHKVEWMDLYNLNKEGSATKLDANEADANIVMLAQVADVLGEDVREGDSQCKHCSFEAQTMHKLNIHIEQTHPKYIRGRYSDDSEEEENEDVPSTSSALTRPVRKCRKKSLPKMIAKEAKMDQIIPPAIKGLPYADDEEDEDYRNDPVLKCHECGVLSMTQTGFVNHMKKTHDQEVVLQYHCEKCEFMGTGKELFVHKRISHIPTLMCESCGKAVKGEKRLQVHKELMCGKPNSRKAPKQVSKECTVCKRMFNSIKMYRWHMKTHRDGDFYCCDVCPETFKALRHLCRHKVNKHTESKYKCHLCVYETPFEDRHKKHLFQKHKIGLENLPIIHCSYEGCAFSTKHTGLMASHKRKHNPLKYKFWCEGCNQAVKTAKSLARHKVLHRDGITKYKCNICGYQATNADIAREHRNKFHSENVTEQKGVMCDICGETFRTATLLKQHHRIQHEQIKPYKCKGCDEVFKYSTKRKQHFKVAHPDLYQAEQEREKQEVEKILNAPSKVTVKQPPKKQPPKKRVKFYEKIPPAEWKKRGKKPLPLTPELIAKRAELVRARNKRRYERREATRKSLGLKRKRYGKRARRQQELAAAREAAAGMSGNRLKMKRAPPVDPDQEAATAARQLENLAMGFSTADVSRNQLKMNKAPPVDPDQEAATAARQLENLAMGFSTAGHQSPKQTSVSNVGVLPVKIVPANSAGYYQGQQPTALQHEYSTEMEAAGVAQSYAVEQVVTTSAGTDISTNYPAFANHEIVIESGTVDEVQQQNGATTSYPVTIDQDGQVITQMAGHSGQSQQPGKYYEVTTVQGDGTKRVEMWPVWQE